jgi:MFS family permease
MVLVPIYLNEIAPKSWRGAFGVVCQIFVVIGIAIAQFLSLFLSTIPYWRVIMLFGGVIGTLHFLLLLCACESPKWVALQPGGQAKASALLRRIRGEDSEHEVRDWRRRSLLSVDTDGPPSSPMTLFLGVANVGIDADVGLLAGSENMLSPISNGPSPAIKELHIKLTIWQFIRSPAYKPMLRAVLIVMLAQQLSGINAVIFYSTSILQSLLPSSSALISLIISLVNLATTIPSASLVDHSGRKPLLLWSISSMGVSSLFLGLGIVYQWRLISVIASLAFVAGFSFGLGPIPFLIIPELVDAEGVSAGQSFGLVINWMATFCVVRSPDFRLVGAWANGARATFSRF